MVNSKATGCHLKTIRNNKRRRREYANKSNTSSISITTIIMISSSSSMVIMTSIISSTHRLRLKGPYIIINQCHLVTTVTILCIHHLADTGNTGPDIISQQKWQKKGRNGRLHQECLNRSHNKAKRSKVERLSLKLNMRQMRQMRQDFQQGHRGIENRRAITFGGMLKIPNLPSIEQSTTIES